MEIIVVLVIEYYHTTVLKIQIPDAVFINECIEISDDIPLLQ